MNRLKQDFKYTQTVGLFLILLLSFSLISCNNDIEKINELSTDLYSPTEIGINIETVYTDSGRIKSRLITPRLERYEVYPNLESPLIVFPEGIKVLFYDKQEKLQSEITADSATYDEKEQLWTASKKLSKVEAVNDVVAKNLQTGEMLKTEILYWDVQKKEIYSDSYTEITSKDGVYNGEEGFTAAQDLSYYRLKNSSGIINAKDEE